MGIGPGDDITKPIVEKRKRELREPAQATQDCISWQDTPDAIRLVEGNHELQNHRLIPSGERKSYFAVYSDEKELFGFFFPFLINEEVPNCVVCHHWDPFKSIKENASGPLYFLLTTAAYVEPLNVIPYLVLDKNMDDVVTSEEVEQESATPDMDSVEENMGNFFPIIKGEGFVGADIIFLNERGQLVPLSWAQVRVDIAKNRSLGDAVKVLLLMNEAQHLPSFMANKFVL